MSTGSLTSTDLDEQDVATADARDARPDEASTEGVTEGATESAGESASESAEVSTFTSTVPNRRIPARAPNGRFVGAGTQGDD